MERKIGEIFEYNGEWYQCVVATQGCRECSFRTHDYCTRHLECLSDTRSDKTSVIFKKLEKVGEPTMLDGKLVQKILTTDRYSCDGCCFESSGCDKAVNDLCCEYEIYVEIKQTKEDMGEEKEDIKPYNKYFSEGTVSNTEHLAVSKFKPFDLEAAKLGKPVCTRDGKKARIICFDRVTNSTNEHMRSLVVLITNPNGDEHSWYYTDEGTIIGRDEYDDYDLMMLPEKREGWVNIYRDCDGANITKDDNIYSSKEAAMASAQVVDSDNYIATTKIKWEE